MMSSLFMNKASEEILKILEKSKNESELAIDRFPGLFMVLDEKGKVYRQNNNISLFYNSENDSNDFFSLLDEQNLEKLNKVLSEAKNNLGEAFDVELNLSKSTKPDAEVSLSLYGWTLSHGRAGSGVFFTVLGKDVTQFKQTVRINEILKHEIQSAEQIQSFMLPEQEFENNFFQLNCCYQSASECGGDFLHYSVRDDQHLRIWVGDVTGHGVGPAMITGATRAAISVLEQDRVHAPLETLMKLNSCIRDIAQDSYWMSFQILDFNFKDQVLEMAQAGHTPLYYLNEIDQIDTKSWQDFTAFPTGTSHIIGAKEQPSFYAQKFPLVPGTLYINFSDGLFEAANPSGQQFGLRRVFKQFMTSYKESKNLAQVQKQLFQASCDFAQVPLQDDISIWTLHYKK